MRLDKLYALAVNGKTLEWVVEVKDNGFRTISGYTDGVKTVSEWTYCQGKNIGKKNATTANEQAEKEAQAMWQKKLDGGFYEDISSINDEKFFKPMLAHKWEDHKDKIEYPIYSQPKLDGIRCIVKKDGMWSRNGKKIISAPHIYESLKSLFEKNPNLIFDGELYADKFANDFNAICSLVKKTKPTLADLNASAKVIEYHIYDLPSHKGIFSERYNILWSLKLPDCCVLVGCYQCFENEDIENYYSEYVDQGYEGQMLRLDKPYENKRSKSLLKHKSFIDEEYTILDVVEGEGNRTGMVGSFIFESKTGKRFNSNLKFNWEESQALWEQKDQLIGKTATVKYFNLTPDGVPRFPYVIKIAREDYE